MPVLRPFNEPNFTTFGEIVDFVNQTLEVRAHAPSIASRLNIVARVSRTYMNNMWHTGEYTPQSWLALTVKGVVIVQPRIF